MKKEILPRLHLASVPQFAAYDCDLLRTPDSSEALALFIKLSVELTGFSEAELLATGMARSFFDELGITLGIPARARFLREPCAAQALLASPFAGPLARNLIRLWYLGQWQELGAKWLEELTKEESCKFDEFGRNRNRVVSAAAYKEGLAWTAVGTNPTGARQPGFGSWAEPPR